MNASEFDGAGLEFDGAGLEVRLGSLAEICDDRALMIAIRESLLKLNDVIERKLDIQPRTAQLRRSARDKRFQERRDYLAQQNNEVGNFRSS